MTSPLETSTYTLMARAWNVSRCDVTVFTRIPSRLPDDFFILATLALALLPDELRQLRHRHGAAAVDRRDRGDVQLQPLNLVVERNRVRWGRGGRRGTRWAGTVRVGFHQDFRAGQIDERVLLGVRVAAGGIDLDRLLP